MQVVPVYEPAQFQSLLQLKSAQAKCTRQLMLGRASLNVPQWPEQDA